MKINQKSFKKNDYDLNYKSQIEWGEVDDYFEKYFLDNIDESEMLSSTKMDFDNTINKRNNLSNDDNNESVSKKTKTA